MIMFYDFLGLFMYMLGLSVDRFMMFAVETHQKKMYIDGITELAGSQNRSLLKELVGFKKAGGRVCFMDGIAPDDEADLSDLLDKKTRADYFRKEAGDQTLANLQLTMTPHHDVEKVRTHFKAKLLEWGHYFDEDEDITELTNSQSITMKQGYKRIVKKEDYLILAAGLAASVIRGRDDDDANSVETVAMPASQIVDDVTYNDVNLDLLDEIRKRFENNFVTGERIITVISPTFKQRLLKAHRKELTSRDFVDSTEYFKNGTLPDVAGLHLVVHPLITSLAPAGTIDSHLSFTEGGLFWGEWKALISDIERDPSHKMDYVAYTREKGNAYRHDDRRVVYGDIIAAG